MIDSTKKEVLLEIFECRIQPAYKLEDSDKAILTPAQWSTVQDRATWVGEHGEGWCFDGFYRVNGKLRVYFTMLAHYYASKDYPDEVGTDWEYWFNGFVDSEGLWNNSPASCDGKDCA